MSTVFVDTSYYIALFTSTDSLHKQAIELTLAGAEKILTTEWVLMELGNYFSPSPRRGDFVRLVDSLRAQPNVVIVPATASSFDDGLSLFSRRRDKDWSLVDCISFNTMHEYGVTEAWTADHHFVQAGFKAILI